MSQQTSGTRSSRSILSASVIAPLLCIIPLLGCVRPLDATQPPHAARYYSPVAAVPAQAAKAQDLAGYLNLSRQQHPRLAVERASLAAAEDGLQALDKLRAPGLIVPELPIRRRQAALGVTAASAALDQAEREAAYAVTRTYFTVLYARDQERVAASVVDRLTATRDAAQKALDAGARDVTAVDVNRASVYVGLAETRRIQAAQGVKRATAALKEAVGLGSDASLEAPVGSLPPVDARPVRDEIIAGALSRRAELIRANIFAEVTCLEVEAQASSHHKKMETFAAGSDIHAAQVPQKEQNSQYKPGAVAPEMPTLLAGPRPERVKRASSFHDRAVAMVETTRNLIVLEAEDAYLRWEEAALQTKAAQEAANMGETLAKDLNKDFTAGQRVKVEDVINAWVLASQARSQYNEALYKQILALADLERVTGGAYSASLAAAPAGEGK